MLFYSHIDLVDKIIEETFETIYTSPEILPGAEYELAEVKLYITLEELWFKNHNPLYFYLLFLLLLVLPPEKLDGS